MTLTAYIDFHNGTTEVIKNVSAYDCKGGFVSVYKYSEKDSRLKDVMIYSNIHVVKVSIVSFEP